MLLGSNLTLCKKEIALHALPITAGFVKVIENLESRGIQEFHFPGPESHGNLLSVLESHGNFIFCLLRWLLQMTKQGQCKIKWSN